MKAFNLLLATLLVATVPAIAQLPDGIVDTQEGDEQPPSPEKSLELITVPDGFNISLFAGEPDVAQPIAIEYDDKGRLWVLESFSYIEWKRTGKDRLLIFEDTDNDGRFDKRTVFWDKGNHTSGFQIGFGGVWLCDAPELLFIPDENRDDTPDGEPRVVLDGWTTKAEHNFFNGLNWGPDGWLYGRHGIKKPSKVGKPGTPDEERVDLSCCIWRYHPVKETFEVWADGTINPWGLDWNEEGEGFIHTSVIDHFWHLVPGARYARTPGKGTASLNPFTYDLMVSTSDHRHWIGGETERKQFDAHDDAGGGHSHCGLVIYQSDAWPEEYRGRAFFSNVLGQRINMDQIEKTSSAYVATHGKDFLKSTSPWFRGVDLKQGPYGEMMIAEWTDIGECHDRDGIHRSSGRLYEVWHGDRPERKPFDVASLSSAELIGLLHHENAWWRRHALRNLHERVARNLQPKTDQPYEPVVTPNQFFSLVDDAKSNTIPKSINAIQALHALDNLQAPNDGWFFEIYDHTFQAEDAEAGAAIRTHLLTLAFTEEEPPPTLINWLEKALQTETNQRVLYRMTALLQRIPIEKRWAVAEAASQIEIPDSDRNFTLMRWYGIEPLVAEDPDKAMKVALETGHPYLSHSIVRRAVAADAMPAILASLRMDGIDSAPMEQVLSGLLEALPAKADLPDGWSEVYALLRNRKEKEIQRSAFQLAQRFGDPEAEKEMVNLVLNEKTPASDRREYFGMLVSAKSALISERIPDLQKDPILATEAIRAEAAFRTPESADRLLALLTAEGSQDDKQDTAILETLASRKDFANALVAKVMEGTIEKTELPAYIVRQLAMLSSKKDDFADYMGLNTEDAEQKSKLIATWKKRLSEDYLANADPRAGREVFLRTCSACHSLYGEGGAIGPDLTGSGRADLDYFLINVLFPSEDVSQDYRLVSLVLKDGRTLTGNIAEENDKVLTFRQVGQIERIDAADVVQRTVLPMSLMPPGLLDTLKRDDVRDLVGYLRTTAPLP